MKYIPLALILTLTLTGCLATAADLRDVSDTVYAMEEGYITREQAVAQIDAKAAEIESRTIKIPTSPADALITILGVGGAAIGTMYGGKQLTNRERDKRRREMGANYVPGSAK